MAQENTCTKSNYIHGKKKEKKGAKGATRRSIMNYKDYCEFAEYLKKITPNASVVKAN